MPKKTPPFKHYPVWTTSRFWSFVRSSLRRSFTRWPPKYACINNARKRLTERERKGKGRQVYKYQCAGCKKYFKRTDVEVDHIVPCGSLKDYSDLPQFVERMFVDENGLQLLCKPCHKEKK